MGTWSWRRIGAISAVVVVSGLIIGFSIYCSKYYLAPVRVTIPNLRTIEAGRYSIACNSSNCVRLDSVTGGLLSVNGTDTEPVLSPMETIEKHKAWEKEAEEREKKYKAEERKKKLEELKKQLSEGK